MFNWITSDPETTWLTITNLMLGIVVAICIAVAVVGISRDLLAKARERAANRQVFVYDAHSMLSPELGLTMADGGEPITKDKTNPKRG